MEEKYSRLGIVSFIISLAVVVFSIILEIVIIVNRPRVDLGGEYAVTMKTLYGLAGFILVILFLVGTGLGVAGMVQKARKKTFAIAGICTNAALLLLFMLGRAL